MNLRQIILESINRKSLNPQQNEIQEYVNSTFGKISGQAVNAKNRSTSWKIGVDKSKAPEQIDSAAEHFKSNGWNHNLTANKKLYTDPHREHILTRPDGNGTHEILRIAHWKQDSQRDNDIVDIFHSHGVSDEYMPKD